MLSINNVFFFIDYFSLLTSTVRDETNVLINKWMKSSKNKQIINAHYDLTMCTQEIIGIIGLGYCYFTNCLVKLLLPSPKLKSMVYGVDTSSTKS